MRTTFIATALICLGAGAWAQDYSCAIKPHGSFSQGKAPETVALSIDDKTGRARVLEARVSDATEHTAFGDVETLSRGRMVVTWKGGPIKRFGGRVVTYRLTVDPSSGDARLKSSASAAYRTIEGRGTCTAR